VASRLAGLETDARQVDGFDRDQRSVIRPRQLLPDPSQTLRPSLPTGPIVFDRPGATNREEIVTVGVATNRLRLIVPLSLLCVREALYSLLFYTPTAGAWFFLSLSLSLSYLREILYPVRGTACLVSGTGPRAAVARGRWLERELWISFSPFPVDRAQSVKPWKTRCSGPLSLSGPTDTRNNTEQPSVARDAKPPAAA